MRAQITSPLVPSELRQIILKLLEVDRKHRYQSAADLCADLGRFKRNGEIRRKSIPTKLIATAAALVLALARYVLYVIYVKLQPKPVLADKDTIVLANFKNSTGDPVFDSTLRLGLSVELEQSPFLRLISDQRIPEELKLMGQQPNAPPLLNWLMISACGQAAQPQSKAESPNWEASMS